MTKKPTPHTSRAMWMWGKRTGWSLLLLALVAQLGFVSANALEDRLGRALQEYNSHQSAKALIRANQAICSAVLTSPNHSSIRAFPTVSDTVLIPGSLALRVLRGWYEHLPIKDVSVLDLLTLSRRPELESRGAWSELGSQMPYFHETVSSLRFSRWLTLKQPGHELLMITSLRGADIPGMDGVILNSTHQPIGNYSLKTVLTGDPISSAKKALRGARRFSELSEWVDVFLQSGNTPGWLLDGLVISGINITSPSSTFSRPYTLVIDIKGASIPLPSAYDPALFGLKKTLQDSQGRIERFVFLKDDQVVEVDATGVKSERIPGLELLGI